MAFRVLLCGRRKATKETKRIFLYESTFSVGWKKDSLITKGLSNSQFVEILLHQNIEELRPRSSLFQETSLDKEEPISSKIYPSHPRASVVFVNLQLLEYFTKAFLQGQLGFIAVFVQLHEFLREQFCDCNKIFVVENGN